MTEEDKVMERYGITRQTDTTFHFAGHNYQRFEDARTMQRTSVCYLLIFLDGYTQDFRADQMKKALLVVTSKVCGC